MSRASFDGPDRAVRCAAVLAGAFAPLHGRARGRVRTARRPPDRAGAGARAGGARSAAEGEILATSTVADLVAGSGIEFFERGVVELPLAGTSREWRLFSVER